MFGLQTDSVSGRLSLPALPALSSAHMKEEPLSSQLTPVRNWMQPTVVDQVVGGGGGGGGGTRYVR
jgi:hypothetical protein